MKIEPLSSEIIVGEVTTCLLLDIPEGATIVVTSGNDNVATATYSDGVISITGVGAGTAVITASDQATVPTIATTTVIVQAAPTFTALTPDGSGTGYDTSVFGRQYIINNNLSGIDEVIGILNRQIKSMKILLTTINSVTLASVIVNLGATLDILLDMRGQLIGSGKNTVTI